MNINNQLYGFNKSAHKKTPVNKPINIKLTHSGCSIFDPNDLLAHHRERIGFVICFDEKKFINLSLLKKTINHCSNHSQTCSHS